MNQEQKDRTNLELARQRLLKANNVQRRRFEKMVDVIAAKAERGAHAVDAQHKRVTHDAIVKQAMGLEYERLMGIRAQIQAYKDKIGELQEAGNKLRPRLRDMGLEVSVSGSYRDGMTYYLDPPTSEADARQKADTCMETVGDPTIMLQIRECRTNPLYVEYERKVLKEMNRTVAELREAADELRATVWGAITTDEIIDAMVQFKKDWDYDE